MNRKWWHGKVAYQVYPKSFCDSNGDGIGDLKGIISKLDYLKDLGVDIIWLSPCYVSPLADQGYDIADYYADMETLIAEAKKRDIGILMDLVVNHCSDEHEWFKKACADPNGRYGKFFYIEKRRPDGSLPCNWRSCFGGPVWDKLPGHEDLYYLHTFHKKQPDLNWENPDLRDEVYKMMNWWLDKGLAGFRIDAIINIKKVLPFKDYPADRSDGLSSINNMLSEQTGIGSLTIRSRLARSSTKDRKKFRSSSGTTAIFPRCLTSRRLSSEEVRSAAMRTAALPRTTTSAASFRHSVGSVISA